jgi:hypothetical protein
MTEDEKIKQSGANHHFSHITTMCKNADYQECICIIRDNDGNVGVMHVGSPQTNEFRIIAKSIGLIVSNINEAAGRKRIITPDDPINLKGL